MAVARDLAGGDENVVAVAGDAAFTCGVSFEALNNVAAQTKRLIVVLNDNEWSIAKNVGAIAEYFHKIATNPTYANLHDRAARSRRKVRRQGRPAHRAQGRGSRQGHRRPRRDLRGVRPPLLRPDRRPRHSAAHRDLRVPQDAERAGPPPHPHPEGPGFEPALEKPEKFHGLGQYEPETGETKPAGQQTYSEIFGETLAKFADTNDKIVAITGAMPSGTGLDLFRPHHPDALLRRRHRRGTRRALRRGLATKGFKPFCAIYSTFMQRAYDMSSTTSRCRTCPSSSAWTAAASRGDDGPTHHGLFDIGYLRRIPNIVHMQPKDEDEFADMLYHRASSTTAPSPSAIRAASAPASRSKEQPKLPRNRQGRSRQIRTAPMSPSSASAACARWPNASPTMLEAKGISAAVINPRLIKPLDHECIARYAGACAPASSPSKTTSSPTASAAP